MCHRGLVWSERHRELTYSSLAEQSANEPGKLISLKITAVVTVTNSLLYGALQNKKI